jgi:hypothetical protein
MAPNSYGQATTDGGVAGAFSARTVGGTVTDSVTTPPTGHTFSYLHTCETASAPCFKQEQYQVQPNEQVTFTVYAKLSAITWAIDPKVEIIDTFQDPLANGTFTALATATLSDTSTDWQTTTITYLNSTAVPMTVLVRATAQDEAKTMLERVDRIVPSFVGRP